MATQIDERVQEDVTRTTGPAAGDGEDPAAGSRLRRWFGGRGTGTGLTASGASLLVALAVGLGLFAAVSNSVLSPGNSAESGTYAYEPPPGPIQLEVALVDPAAPAGACDTATYDSAVLPAILTASADLDVGTITPVDVDVCVRTAGTFDAYLVLSNSNVLEVEVGACEASEAGVGGDPTCADGDEGELSILVDYYLEDATATCPFVYSYPQLPETRTEAMIPAGTTCRYDLRSEVWPGADDVTLLRAQTDAVSWDIGFSLVDDPFEPNDDAGAAWPLPAGTPLSATINPEVDQDWYFFTHAGGTLTAETTGPCDAVTGDTVVTVYQGDGTTVVISDDDGGTGSCSLASAPLAAGDYYVVVESYLNSSFVSRYDLTVTSTP